MLKHTGIFSALLSFVLVFGVGICIASATSGSKESASKSARTKNAATKKATTASKNASTAHQRATKSATKSSSKKSDRTLASAEDLSGTIESVDAGHKRLTLIGSNGVPYDFDWTHNTKLESSNQKIDVKQLFTENYKEATVHFVPMSGGQSCGKHPDQPILSRPLLRAPEWSERFPEGRALRGNLVEPRLYRSERHVRIFAE